MKKNSLTIFLTFMILLNLFAANLSQVLAVTHKLEEPQLLVDSEYLTVTVEKEMRDASLQLKIVKRENIPTKLSIHSIMGKMIDDPESTFTKKESDRRDIFQETDFTRTPEEQIILLAADTEGKLTFSLALFSEEDEGKDPFRNLLTEKESGPYFFDFNETDDTENSREEIGSNETTPTKETTESIDDSTSTTTTSTSEVIADSSNEMLGSNSNGLPEKNMLSTKTKSHDILALTRDPFKYITESAGGDQGIVPVLGTSKYLGSGAQQNKTIKNYDYGNDDSEGGSDPFISTSKINEHLNFDNGYHHYDIDMGEQHGRAETKQTIKPTDEENVFEVTLDTIGDALKVEDKLDIVFVIDSSSSMIAHNGQLLEEEERGWVHMKRAIKGFCEELVKEPTDGGDARVRVGLTAFGSTNNGKFRPYGDIATFNGSATSPQYFTSKIDDILSHRIFYEKHLLEKGSGTPTFLGVDAGLTVLHEQGRADAKQVLITITDGEAAFSPNLGYYEDADKQTAQPGFIYSLKNGKENAPLHRYYTKEGTTTADKNDKNIHTLRFLIDYNKEDAIWENKDTGGGNGNNPFLIKKRFDEVADPNSAAKIESFISYGVAFKVPEGQAQSAKEITLALAQNNEKRAVIADNSSEFIMLLSNFFSSYRDTIFGKLIAPLSDAVSYISGSAEVSALLLNTSNHQLTEIVKSDRGPSLPAFASYAEVEEPTPEKNQFTIDRLHLGIEPKLSRTGIGESYKTGEGETATQDPDIRQGYRLSYRVKLKESHQDGIYHQVAQETYLENTIDVHRAEKGNVAPRLYYAIPSARSSSRTRFTKRIAGTTTELAGVTFGLYPRDGDKEHDKNAQPAKRSNVSDHTGLVEFENVIAGDYWLVELEQPDLYQQLAPMKVTVDDAGKLNEVNVNGLKGLSEVENHLKDLVLKINKTDQSGEPMEEVIFTLEGEEQKISFTTTSKGCYLSDPITPGTYLLKEQLPKKLYPGYQQEKILAELVFSKTGEISYDDMTSDLDSEILKPTVTTGGDGSSQQLLITRDIQNKLKPYDLVVTKIGQDGLEDLLSGAEFTLYNEDGSQELGKETSDLTGKLTFTGLITAGNNYRLQETKAPEDHQLLESFFTLSVNDTGEASLTYDGNSMPITLTLSNDDKNNQLEALVSNRRNFSLPDAGVKPEADPLRWMIYAFIPLSFFVAFVRPKRRK